MAVAVVEIYNLQWEASMGAWGCKSFGNDDALDWVFELQKTSDFSSLSLAFTELLAAQGDYLDVSYCTRALAAAKVVAALKSMPAEALPEEVSQWLAGKPQPGKELTADAKKTVEAVLVASELKELWEESDELIEWQADMQGLLERLH